jgi:hypothetical protein
MGFFRRVDTMPQRSGQKLLYKGSFLPLCHKKIKKAGNNKTQRAWYNPKAKRMPQVVGKREFMASLWLIEAFGFARWGGHLCPKRQGCVSILTPVGH